MQAAEQELDILGEWRARSKDVFCPPTIIMPVTNVSKKTMIPMHLVKMRADFSQNRTRST